MDFIKSIISSIVMLSSEKKVLICSIRGCFRNFQTGDKAWGTAFGILIPASAYFLADLLGLLPPGAPRVFM